MKDFKIIAEQVLAGKITGFFILRDGTAIHSSHLQSESKGAYIYKLHNSTYTEYGNVYFHINSKKDIIKFKKKEEKVEEKRKIEINVPEDKIAIIEETSEKITIIWKEKELTYEDIANKILDGPKHIPGCFYNAVCDTTSSTPFYAKVNALRKLTNIRNYFGKPDENEKGWIIEQGGIRRTAIESHHYSYHIIFAEREHAEQAIKILGDELKHLFEPW